MRLTLLAALALTGDAGRGGDVLPRLNSWGRSFADTYQALNHGAHGAHTGDPGQQPGLQGSAPYGSLAVARETPRTLHSCLNFRPQPQSAASMLSECAVLQMAALGVYERFCHLPSRDSRSRRDAEGGYRRTLGQQEIAQSVD